MAINKTYTADAIGLSFEILKVNGQWAARILVTANGGKRPVTKVVTADELSSQEKTDIVSVLTMLTGYASAKLTETDYD